jgi:diamine N-acetyltransferase
MPPPPLITRISAQDLERVQRLAMDIWPKCYRNIIAPDQIDGMLSSLYAIEALEAEMAQEGQVFWVCQVGSDDVGYASAQCLDGTLWLKKLYVMDAYRGLGIGKLFICEALTLYPMTKTLSLNVNCDNKPAIDYYLASGFVVHEKRDVTMGPYGFVDFIMQKNLLAA